MRQLIFAAILLVSFSGCAVVMAMQGKEEPDLTVVEVGATRGQIEIQLGTPYSSEPVEEGGSLDVYEVEMGNEPSPMRAVVHGFMDLLTLFIWEPVGTVIEGMQGTTKYIEVEYDENDYAALIKTLSEPRTARSKASKDDDS